MKRLLMLVVVVLSILAGMLLVGAPETITNDLEAVDIPPSTSTTSTTLPPTTTLPPATTSPSTTTTTSATTTSAVSTSTVSPTPTTDATTTTAPPRTSTSTTTTAVAVTTSSLRATTAATTTTAPIATTSTLPDEASVVVVIANASDTFGLATLTADRIGEFGYVFVIRTDGVRELPNTAIYFAAGFEGEARRLAGQLDMSLQLVDLLPDERLYEGTAQAEVLLLLGNDWPNVTNLDPVVGG